MFEVEPLEGRPVLALLSVDPDPAEAPDLGWLCADDPGELVGLPVEPPCWEDCGCPSASVAAADLAAAVGLPAAWDRAPGGSVGWATPGVPVQGAAGAGLSPLLIAVGRALDAVEAAGPVSGSRADTAQLWALAERARGLALRELAQMDAVDGHLLPGRLSTTASWLREERVLTDGAARAAVGLARQLRDDLPELGAALRAGQVTVEHAGAVLAGVRGLDRDIVREAAGGLCALARAADPVAVRGRLRDLATAVDDRLAAEVERRARERIGLRLSEVGTHTAVDGTLVGEGAATVRLAMALAVETDRVDGDRRSRAARQADVLVGWAADYLHRAHGPGDSTASDAHTVRTHLLITCTPEQLAAATGHRQHADQDRQHADQDRQQVAGPGLAELIDGLTGSGGLAGAGMRSAGIVGGSGPLSRGALRRLACDATLDLVVLRSPGTGPCGRCPTGSSCQHRADPLYVGRTLRTVTGAQFRALVVRDRTCVVAGCTRPPARCVAHHVRHWTLGGNTDLDNLVLLCHQHHHDHHDRGLDLPHRDRHRWLTSTGWALAPPAAVWL